MDYIYHKKPDGSIEPIEVTEENKAAKLRAYNIEKQLREQKGQEFGTIYKNADSLPDEDKVTVGLMTSDEYISKYKALKISEVSAKCKTERETFFPMQVYTNLLAGAGTYPEIYTIENYGNLVNQYISIYDSFCDAVKDLTTAEEVDSEFEKITWPTAESITASLQEA